MGFLSWLSGGDDHQLAQTRYAGRESATDRAARVEHERRQKQRRNHHRQAGNLQLVEAAEATFTETLAELTAGALGGPSALAAVQVLSELRSVLERHQVGLPTG